MSDAPLFIVGDVQGCADELDDLLAQAGYDRARHRLAFVGDLINRGPKSRAVLERAVAEGAQVVVGNHEEGLLDGKPGEMLDRVRAELGAELPRWLAWIGALKGLDTGCVYGGALTGLWWPRCEWISVPARRRWFDPTTMRPLW